VAEIFFHDSLGINLPLVIIMTMVLGFLVGELVPKSAAVENPESTARMLLPLVRAFSVVTRPFVNITATVSGFIARVAFRSLSSRSLMFQRRDVYRFLGSTVSSGYLDKIESDMIRRLLANAAVPVRNIAVPRTEIVAAKAGMKVAKLREISSKPARLKS